MGKHIFLMKGLHERKSEIHSQLQQLGLSLLESTSTKGHETHVKTDFCLSVGGQTCPLHQTALEERLDASIHRSHEVEGIGVADNQINQLLNLIYLISC